MTKGVLRTFLSSQWAFAASAPARVRVLVCIAASLNVLVMVGLMIYLHVEQHGGPRFFLHWRFWVGADRSFAEIVASAQLAAAAVVLLVLWLQRPTAKLYLGWASLFLVMVADDLGRLHEEGSRILRTLFELPVLPGLRPHDTGELISWFVIGIAPVTLLIILHLRALPSDRVDSWGLATCVTVLAFFAIGVDMFQIMLEPLGSRTVMLTMTGIESFGEMMASTLIFGYALLLAVRDSLSGRAASHIPEDPER